MNRHEPPSLEQRIVIALANQYIGSEALFELIREVEAAATAAGQSAAEQRKLALDLVDSPDAKAAHERVVNAELTRDRLNANVPKLRDKLTEALAAEQRDRWWSEYKKVKIQLDSSVVRFQEYQSHAQAIADLLAEAEQVDKAISDLNGRAPNGVDRRLRSVELTARGMMAFSRDNPPLATTVVLPNWDCSAKTLWPQRPSTSLAVAFAESSMIVPHPGAAWSTPEVQQARRAQAEKENAQMAVYHDQAQAAEEERINREAREQFAQAHKRG